MRGKIVCFLCVWPPICARARSLCPPPLKKNIAPTAPPPPPVLPFPRSRPLSPACRYSVARLQHSSGSGGRAGACVGDQNEGRLGNRSNSHHPSNSHTAFSKKKRLKKKIWCQWDSNPRPRGLEVSSGSGGGREASCSPTHRSKPESSALDQLGHSTFENRSRNGVRCARWRVMWVEGRQAPRTVDGYQFLGVLSSLGKQFQSGCRFAPRQCVDLPPSPPPLFLPPSRARLSETNKRKEEQQNQNITQNFNSPLCPPSSQPAPPRPPPATPPPPTASPPPPPPSRPTAPPGPP